LNFRPDGIGKYSFVGDNEIVFNKPEYFGR